MEILLNWIDGNQPDVLCLQETKVRDEEFPVLPFMEAGYHAVFRGEKSYNGVAVISRSKPKLVSFGFDDGDAPDETRLARADFGSVHIVNTYIPQGRDIDHPMYRYKLEWFRRLKAFFDSEFTPRMKVLWLGDFNVAPEPKDIHNPERQSGHVCFHEDVRQALADVMEWGFTDVFREFHPEAGHYTFFDYRTREAVKRKMGWRVDHMMATRSMTRKCKSIAIDLQPRKAEKPSDHAVLVGEFDVKDF